MEKFIEEHGGAVAYAALFLMVTGLLAGVLTFFSGF